MKATVFKVRGLQAFLTGYPIGNISSGVLTPELIASWPALACQTAPDIRKVEK